MIALDTSTVVLALAITTLCIATAGMSLGLTSITLRRRQPAPPAPTELPPIMPVRRVITGRPAVLPTHRALVPPPIELGPVPRPNGTTPDRPVEQGEVGEAIAFVEELIDHEPERLAELISLWINEDPS